MLPDQTHCRCSAAFAVYVVFLGRKQVAVLPQERHLQDMTRGNQREIDRQRAAKRKDKAGVTQKDKDGLTAAQRRER
jgi:hypothetical protein